MVQLEEERWTIGQILGTGVIVGLLLVVCFIVGFAHLCTQKRPRWAKSYPRPSS